MTKSYSDFAPGVPKLLFLLLMDLDVIGSHCLSQSVLKVGTSSGTRELFLRIKAIQTFFLHSNYFISILVLNSFGNSIIVILDEIPHATYIFNLIFI